MDLTDRNDVLGFWQAIYDASEGFESRPVFKEHPTANFYAPDFTVPYSYTYVAGAAVNPPVLTKANGVPAAGELSLSFVKDVERRVNFFRAVAGVPAGVALMDSDTQKSSATVAINNSATYVPFQPAATTLKADAAQKSAYMIARTYKDRYYDGTYLYGMYHVLTTASKINGLSAFSKEAWNGNLNSNLALGFFGPTAIDRYMSEDIENSEAGENSGVGHRRLVIGPTYTQFATGDVPGFYTGLADAPGNPQIRQSTNALYVLQRPVETAVVAHDYTAYPAPGFFPAPLNTPYWSLGHPDAVFTPASTVTMSTSAGVPITTGTPLVTAVTPVPSLSWPVLDATASARSVAADQTINVTVSNFTIGGVPATRSYSVTLINPDRIQSQPTLVGANAPPAGGTANYFFTAPKGAEAVQVNTFQEIAGTWIENADNTATTKVISHTYGNYDFLSAALPASTGKSYHLTHPVRYDVTARGVPEQSFEIDREIIPSTAGTSKLKFSYRRAYMTASSTLVFEKSADNGASWTTLNQISGSLLGTPDLIPLSTEVTLAASPTPLRIRFRFYKSGTGSTYNQQDSAGNQTGIFIDDITTTNTTTYDLKKTNELSPATDRFTLTPATAGTALAANQPLHLRFRTKLGNHWFQYGAPKIVTPTTAPLPGFDGWFAYEYPTLSGGFSGDDDGDGEANAIEFAFFENPLEAGKVADKVSVSAVPSGSGSRVSKAIVPATFSISRPVPALRDGIEYGAEWSDTLAPESWSSVGVSISFDGSHVIATAPQGTGKRFLRWKVSDDGQQ